MNVFFPTLMDKFSQLASVQCYHMDRAGYISGIEVFPSRYRPDQPALDSSKAYICSYRDLRFQEPTLVMPPLICVVEPGAAVDEVFFSNRIAAVVRGKTVTETLLLLSQLLYEYGCGTSELTDLSHALLECKNILDLIEVGYEALQNPIIVTDSDQKIIAYTDPHVVSAPSFQGIISMENLPANWPDNWLNPAWGSSVFALPEAPDIGLPDGLGMKLMVKSKIVGYLNVISYNHPYTEHDAHVMELMGNLLAVELLHHPHSYPKDTDMEWEHFLREILDSTAGDVSDILAEAQALRLKLKPHLCVIVVQTKDDSPSPHESFYTLAKLMAGRMHNTFGFLYRNSAFLLLGADEELVDLDTVLAPIQETLETYNLAAGVSNWFPSVHQLRAFAFQSRKALQLGCRLHKNKRVYYYKDYSIYRMLELCLQADSMESFCSPELLRLSNYSRQNENDLYETLRTYLQCGRNKTQTAREMYVHVSTIKYRMSQIQEIIDLDLDNDDNALKLMLSFKLLECQELLQKDEPVEEFWKG